MQRESIHERARGRWRSILLSREVGVPAALLNGNHQPCPFCGGRDRFRWDDKGGGGGYFCGGCNPGTGLDFVMKFKHLTFVEAVKLIEPLCGSAPVVIPKARADTNKYGDELWASGKPLNGIDAASKYLTRRGIRLMQWPALLRFAPSVSYKHEDGSRTRHPAMLSRFIAADQTAFTTHVTYLHDTGRKADLPSVKKFAPGRVPAGGAVRLAQSGPTLGIAEGIETALSASIMDGVPVWSALDAGMLIKWQPPPTVKAVIIYGDNDSSFTGQAAAYALAHRLKRDGLHVDVRLPDMADTDWNDLVQTGAAA